MAIFFVIGRIILGGFFIHAGYNHFKNLGMLAGYAASKNVPAPKLSVIVSGLLAFLGGLSVVLGYAPVQGLSLLILFMIPISFSMHAFWKEKDANNKNSDKTAFLKNMAILGALLMLLALPIPWVNSF